MSLAAVAAVLACTPSMMALLHPAVVGSAAIMVGTLMPRVAHAVDVNQATSQDLKAVRGIGPKTAQMIVDERQRGGPFASMIDLSERVKGIGPKKAAALQAGGLVVGPAGSGGKAASAARPGTPKKRKS